MTLPLKLNNITKSTVWATVCSFDFWQTVIWHTLTQ